MTTNPQQPYDALSNREFQVAALVALALTDQQISKSLFISVSTVKAHIANIKSKLGLNTRVEVVRWMLVSHYEGKIILFDNVL